MRRRRAKTIAPGLSAIAYRTGVWGTFKNSMLARLSSADYPALAGLKTRDDDDFSIALLDASAMMLDVLTFYQERLANESYLRTATQLSSLTELSRLIGYRPSPGVAASTYLAFTIKAAPGAPADPTATAVTIPAGTKAQSVPAQGQTPQTFETSRDILAKADWNALPVQTGLGWQPKSGDTSVYLAGTSTQLNPGDAILIVGDERANPPHTSENWDVRIVSAVEPDGGRNRTRVVWSEGLGHGGRRACADQSKILRAAAAGVAVRLQRRPSASSVRRHSGAIDQRQADRRQSAGLALQRRHDRRSGLHRLSPAVAVGARHPRPRQRLCEAEPRRVDRADLARSEPCAFAVRNS